MKVRDRLSASLVLRRGARGQVGYDRIGLLRAVERGGSISAAAKAQGLSYKGAWDIIQALNNLFDQPLVETRAGGRRGGEALVTPEGRALIAAFEALEGDLDRAVSNLERRLAEPANRPLQTLLWSLAVKTSARNLLRGRVVRIVDGAINAEVTLDLGEGARLTAVVTRASVEDLALAPDREALALIKSSFILLAKGDGPLRTSARNALDGVVVRIEEGAVSSEVSLEIGSGKALVATITRPSVEALDLKVGDRATALIKASHVILAVEG
jgi:molybdate transport system regulatory protein